MLLNGMLPLQARLLCTVRSGALLVICLMVPFAAAAQVRPACTLFDASGKKRTHQRLLRTVGKADVVLFGELHNNPIAHWLQSVLARSGRPGSIGAGCRDDRGR